MNREQPPINDIELLSAFIDGELSDAERIELNNRLESEPALKAELDSLQTTVEILNSLPMLKAPRDFRLDPAVYGRKAGGGIISLSTWRVVSAVGVAAAVVLVAGSLLLGGTKGDSQDESAGNQIAFDPNTRVEGQEEIEAVISPSETTFETAGSVTSNPNANIPAVEEAEAEVGSTFADDDGGDGDLDDEADQSAEDQMEQDTFVPNESPFPAGAPPVVSTNQPQQAPEAMAEGFGGSGETTELPPEDMMGTTDMFNGEAEEAGETGRSADTEDRDEQQPEETSPSVADAGPSSRDGWAWIDALVTGLKNLVVSLNELIYSILLGQ